MYCSLEVVTFVIREEAGDMVRGAPLLIAVPDWRVRAVNGDGTVDEHQADTVANLVI